jgi:hypothetical protein
LATQLTAERGFAFAFGCSNRPGGPSSS